MKDKLFDLYSDYLLSSFAATTATLYTVGEVSLPVTYRLVIKTESCIDKQGRRKRRSAVTKNEHFRAMLQNCVHNRIPFRYLLNEIWFASAENMT